MRRLSLITTAVFLLLLGSGCGEISSGWNSMCDWVYRTYHRKTISRLESTSTLHWTAEEKKMFPALYSIRRMKDLPDIPDDEADRDLDVDGIPASVIQDMIRRLPDGYRTVFNLFVFEDMSHKEIARTLGIKENSSASQYHRAKALLAKWLKDYRNEQND